MHVQPTSRWLRRLARRGACYGVGLVALASSTWGCGGGQGDSFGRSSSTSNADGTTTHATTGTGSTASTVAPTTGGLRFDLPPTADVPQYCYGGSDEVAFSHIWIANHYEDTVSKINTQTLVEEGRYRTQPAEVSGGSPSRTSVNLNGDVAVANRCLVDPGHEGCAGVVMIAAVENRCVDRNSDGMITTSTGANDVKAWGEDECVLWRVPFAVRSNRPVAWTAGDLDPSTCHWNDPKVWTATSVDGDDTRARVYLIDEQGVIEEQVTIEGWDGSYYSVYGGAVDSEGDFWFSGGYGPNIGHVRRSDLSYEIIPLPTPFTPYGFIIDRDDRPWVATGEAVMVYDRQSQSWEWAWCEFNCSAITQTDNANIWLGGWGQTTLLAEIDSTSLTVLRTITRTDVPEMDNARGLAADVEGFLWAVENGTEAFKFDPRDKSYEIFTNPSEMYTYSDMTGHGLANVSVPRM